MHLAQVMHENVCQYRSELWSFGLRTTNSIRVTQKKRAPCAKKKVHMRGFSPKLILGKQPHPLFQEQMEETRLLPGFSDALRFEADWIVGQYSDNADPYYAKYVGDVANVLIENSAVYFDLLLQVEATGVGATLGKLQLVAFVHGYASPRRVTMYIKRLAQDGRVKYASESQDRRVRRLVPCEPLLATQRQNILGLLRAAERIWPVELAETKVCYPDGEIAHWTADQHGFFERLVLAKGKLYLSGCDPLRPFGDVRHFTSKDAGSFLLFSILRKSINETGKPSTDVQFALNYSDAAQLTGVSRTHVRNVIEGAEERGLISDLGEGGRSMRLTAKLIESAERYFACLMLLTKMSAIQGRESLIRAASGK